MRRNAIESTGEGPRYFRHRSQSSRWPALGMVIMIGLLAYGTSKVVEEINKPPTELTGVGFFRTGIIRVPLEGYIPGRGFEEDSPRRLLIHGLK